MSEKLTVLGKEYEIELKEMPKLNSYEWKDGIIWEASYKFSKIKITGTPNNIKNQAITNLHAAMYQYLKIMEQEN